MSLEDECVKCTMCDGWGFVDASGTHIECDWCNGRGWVTQSQLQVYMTPPAFEDWKSRRELQAIDEAIDNHESTRD